MHVFLYICPTHTHTHTHMTRAYMCAVCVHACMRRHVCVCESVSERTKRPELEKISRIQCAPLRQSRPPPPPSSPPNQHARTHTHTHKRPHPILSSYTQSIGMRAVLACFERAFYIVRPNANCNCICPTLLVVAYTAHCTRMHALLP